MQPQPTLDLFCRVIDNLGDIGVCWRLARQLVNEHQCRVTLWVDGLSTFKKLCAAIDLSASVQTHAGVVIRQWPYMANDWSATGLADVVIGAFGCELPTHVKHAIAARIASPIAWFNLEYLTAESWIDDCHLLPSVDPHDASVKRFFFPGFSSRSGGLLREHGLIEQRNQFQNQPAQVATFLTTIGVVDVDQAFLISLFCYPSAPIAELLNLLANQNQRCVCLIPEGIAERQLAEFFGIESKVGDRLSRASLTVQRIRFLDQDEYDRLLWSCDFNIVRGEDSLVRAQWAARPLLWQIYAQQDAVHLIKLKAFQQRYLSTVEPALRATLIGVFDWWNNSASSPQPSIDFPILARQARPHAERWASMLASVPDLATQLVRAINKIS